jgi:Holliday junction resolvase
MRRKANRRGIDLHGRPCGACLQTRAWLIFAFWLLGATPFLAKCFLKIFPGNAELIANEKRIISYNEAHEDWVLTKTEKGALYWQGLNGLDFERAVHRLFVRRGCQATLTKQSGDGGIDIILTIGDQKYSCQCKAHKKPIGVATIRQIVGSCVHFGGKPVVISTNGFTKPALQIASDLNVVCLSTHDLCRLAGKDKILQLG